MASITVDDSVGITEYLWHKLLDHLTGIATYTAPTDLYVQLHVGLPGALGTTNISAGDPTRRVMTYLAATGLTMPVDGPPTFTNGGVSETLKYFSVHDASSAGNCLWTGKIGTDRPWSAGGTFTPNQCGLPLQNPAA